MSSYKLLTDDQFESQSAELVVGMKAVTEKVTTLAIDAIQYFHSKGEDKAATSRIGSLYKLLVDNQQAEMAEALQKLVRGTTNVKISFDENDKSSDPVMRVEGNQPPEWITVLANLEQPNDAGQRGIRKYMKSTKSKGFRSRASRNGETVSKTTTDTSTASKVVAFEDAELQTAFEEAAKNIAEVAKAGDVEKAKAMIAATNGDLSSSSQSSPVVPMPKGLNDIQTAKLGQLLELMAGIAALGEYSKDSKSDTYGVKLDKLIDNQLTNVTNMHAAAQKAASAAEALGKAASAAA